MEKRGVRISEKDKNKDKSRQSRARYRKECEKTSPRHLQMRIMLVVKIHAVALLVVCNFWVIDLLAGRLKGRKVLRYPVRKLNILLCLAVVYKSFG
ncbi:hypothetical protein Tco_1171481 [Tanacetum coccineum]